MNAAVKLEMPEQKNLLTIAEIRQAFALAGDEKSLQAFDLLVAEQEETFQKCVTLLREIPPSLSIWEHLGSQSAWSLDQKLEELKNEMTERLKEIDHYGQTARETLESAERAGEIPAPVAKP